MQSQDPGTVTRPAARPRSTRDFVVRPLGSVLLALGAFSLAACSGSAATTTTAVTGTGAVTPSGGTLTRSSGGTYTLVGGGTLAPA